MACRETALQAIAVLIGSVRDYGADAGQERRDGCHEVAGGKGGDDGAFADAFDAACEGKRAEHCQTDKGDVEAYFEASEFAAIAS